MDRVKSRLLLVSDNQLLLDCLGLMLHGVQGFTVEALALDAMQARQALQRSAIDQVILCIELPGALELAAEIEQRCSGVRVVMIGVPVDERDILNCVRVGVEGITSDQSGVKAFFKTIAWPCERGFLLCPEATIYVLSRLEQLSEQSSQQAQADCLVSLSFREIEILRKLSLGLTNKEIATELFLSLYTVKNHVHSILRKLQVASRAEAVAYAAQRGWVSTR